MVIRRALFYVRYLLARWAFWRASRRRPRRQLALVEHFLFTMLAAAAILFVILVAIYQCQTSA